MTGRHGSCRIACQLSKLLAKWTGQELGVAMNAECCEMTEAGVSSTEYSGDAKSNSSGANNGAGTR